MNKQGYYYQQPLQVYAKRDPVRTCTFCNNIEHFIQTPAYLKAKR